MRTLAAIMFTDIAGYTALMQEDEENAREIRNAHRSIFNRHSNTYQGKILQYYGDGTLSTFKSVYQAVRCGIELQQSFQAEGIPVRIGIHLGEIIFDQEEIIGDAVNVASRIESLAAVGSVLLSGKIQAELSNRSDIDLRYLGEFQFKNVSQLIEVFAVEAEGLYVPLAQDLGGKLENKNRILELPAYSNSFIGRNHQVKSLCDLLDDEKTRLITILGPGGMGKTRLASRVGELKAEDFSHGVCFVPLDSLNDPTQVPLHIGNQLGLKESFHGTWLEVVIEFLQNKQLLLILDNLEQILQAGLAIQNIVESCPGVKVLVTSREILALSEEVEFTLGSLNRPNPLLFPGPNELLQFEAIHLFVQQAQLSVPNFQLTQENAEAVVKICHFLEGLPLPIVLASARLKLFSPRVIFMKLEGDNALLKTKTKNVSPRHQTIKNTVRWSYDLLDAEEQLIFQRLSLFQGGFTLDSLEAVCPDVDSLEVVESFINKSLIVKGKEVDLVPRFRMLKLIRDYGLEQLETNPEAASYQNDFANYFMKFTEEAIQKLGTEQQIKWTSLMDAEYQNLSAALEWLIKHLPLAAAQMGAQLWPFHINRGYLREGLNMVEALMSLEVEEEATRAKLLQGAGSLSHNLGDYLKAKEYFELSLELTQSLGNKEEIARAMNHVAWAGWRVGNYASTLSYAESANKIFEELGDELGQAVSQNNISWISHYRGFFEEAEKGQRKVLEIQKKYDNRRGEAFANVCLARVCLKLGKYFEAENLIEQSIGLFQELKSQQLLAFTHLIKAELALEQKEYRQARSILIEHCLTQFEKIGDVWGVASSNHYLGKRSIASKEYKEANNYLNRGLGLFRKASDKFGEASIYISLSQLNQEINKVSAVMGYLDTAIELARHMQAHELLMQAYLCKSHQCLKEAPEKSLKYLLLADFYAGKLGEFQFQSFQSSIESHLLEMSGVLSEKMDKPARDLWEEHEFEDLFGAGHINSRLENWLRKQSEEQKPREDASPIHQEVGNEEAEDSFVKRIRQLVEDRLVDPDFSVSELCKDAGYSHSQLHRKLHSASGKSISSFIRDIRLAKAKQLLKDPQLTVAAVAYDSGFKDPDYFYRVFKKNFKMTPREYQKQMGYIS